MSGAATEITGPQEPPLLLAFDPSLACLGAALVTLDGRGALVGGFAIKTESECGSEWALERHHEEGRRALRLFHTIRSRTQGRNVACVAMEAPLGARSAQAAWALGRAQVATLCAVASCWPALRPMSVSSFAAKKRAAGTKRPKDAKADVRAGVQRHWGPKAWAQVLRGIRDQKRREAIFDAAAVALVGLRQPSARLVIQDHAGSR